MRFPPEVLESFRERAQAVSPEARARLFAEARDAELDSHSPYDLEALAADEREPIERRLLAARVAAAMHEKTVDVLRMSLQQQPEN